MLRLDRLLTLYCFSPLRKLGPAKNSAIPILMYHSISDSWEEGIHPYFRLATAPDVFAQHMALLADQGYQVIGLDAAANLLRGDNSGYQAGLTRPVVITFDDGFQDFYINAFPILDGHGFTATVFLPTSFIKDEKNTTIMGRAFLSWHQVRELVKAGITFGSHTVSHSYLPRMAQPEIAQELQQSKETIEGKTGKPVRAFSCPFAFPEHDKGFVHFLRNILQVSGYAYAVSTRIGRALPGEDIFSLKRLPVNAVDDSALLKAKLSGGYDWMHRTQVTVKEVRRLLGLHQGSTGKWISQ